MENSNSLSVLKNNSLAKTEKTVTTKELAEALGVTPRTIQQVVEKLGLAKSISQVKIRGQNSYTFTEAQATAIKVELQNHSKIAKNGFNTLDVSNDVEGELLVQRAMAYQQRKIEALQKGAELAENTLERIANGKGCFSMNQAAKALKLGYGDKTLFKKLKEMGILNADNTPRQEHVNAERFKVIVKYINEYVGNKKVTLVTSKGLVYLAKRFNTTIDESVMADAE